MGDDEEGLFSPLDVKYAPRQSPRRVVKDMPAIPYEGTGEVSELRIPRKVQIRRQVAASRKPSGRSSGAVTRSTSHWRRPSVRSIKSRTLPRTSQAKGRCVDARGRKRGRGCDQSTRYVQNLV